LHPLMEHIMNNILNDIKKLQDIQASIGQFSVSTVKSFIQDIIDEKNKQIEQFETDKMSYKEYEEHMKGRGFNDR